MMVDFAPLDFKKEGIVLDYKRAGVDIDAGNSFVENIKPLVKSTHRPEVVGGFGGFNGMIRIPEGYEKPVLVSGADGVGTKSQLSSLFDKDYGIGIDLVAMCVNDVITCGAEPLYFLDYISCQQVKDNKKILSLVEGIAEGCRIAGCTLLGGETAEHPQEVGTAPAYDISGFCTGVVEQNEIIDGKLIRPGDKIIGIESSGLHSNGFSLIRYLVTRHKILIKEHPELLNPTIIYAPVVKTLLDEVPILGMAHITGGGIPENLPRCIPEGLTAQVDYNSWPLPEIFKTIMLEGNTPEEEMKRIFNLGIGYCLVVPEDSVSYAQDVIKSQGLKSWTIGKIVVK